MMELESRCLVPGELELASDRDVVVFALDSKLCQPPPIPSQREQLAGFEDDNY